MPFHASPVRQTTATSIFSKRSRWATGLPRRDVVLWPFQGDHLVGGGNYEFVVWTESKSCHGVRGGDYRALLPDGQVPHQHLTWMDEAGISYILQSERMGHEVPGMRGVYSHVSAAMRKALAEALEAMWVISLRYRAQLSPRSAVAILDRLLTPYRPLKAGQKQDRLPIRSQNRTQGCQGLQHRKRVGALTCDFACGAEGI